MQPIKRRDREKGIALLVTTASMFLVLPVVGLAIDAGFLYAVRARLTAATDAAAVAAARSLSKGLTIGEQEASAQARARAFFDANFPDGDLNTVSKTVEVVVDSTQLKTRTVFVRGSVDVGLFFMRTLGKDLTTVRAEGRASRRDVNLMLVLDRSGSMDNSGSCEPMKTAARTFLNHFANQRDTLGMITFGMTYYLASPPTQNFKPSLDTTIAGIDCSGGTGTAQALWKGHQELKTLNEPGALNLLVFFTDGLPNGISADFPVKKKTDQRYGYGQSPYDSTSSTYNMEPSTCRDSDGDKFDRRSWQSSRTYFAPNWNPFWTPGDKTGTMAGQGNGSDSTGYTFGVAKIEASSLTQHNEGPIDDDWGCTFQTWSRVRRDIAYIPDSDKYNNDTHGYNSLSEFPAGHTYEGKIRPDKPSNLGKASKNAADHAARRIRTDPSLPGLIFSIGLGDPGGGSPPDPEFMRRVANDPDAGNYDDTQPTGLYVFAPDNTELAEAFYRVASEVLRISH